MPQDNGTPPSAPNGNEMSADEVADLTHDILLDLYDDTLLNDCHERLVAGEVPEALADLGAGLNERLQDSSEPEWNGFVKLCMAHPIRELLHQDPFTRRAYEKPRGYAGDAELLDFIYHVDDGKGPPEGTSELGIQIFEVTTRTTLCQRLRTWAQMVAEDIDQLAVDRNQPEILSVAAGHLREAQLSQALAKNQLGRWVAFDSDVDTLQRVRQSLGKHGVETQAGTVRQIVANKISLGQFDLIHATGLYGYLQQPIGQRLTTRLFEMLRPGGTLLIANFSEDIGERGYLESFMDWHLNYRSQAAIMDLAADIDETQVGDVRLSLANRSTAGDRFGFVLLRIEKQDA